jgi:alpha-glucosidase
MGLMKPNVRRVCFAISVAAVLTAGRPGAAASEEWEVRSPDGALVFVLRLGAAGEPDAGRLSYTLVRASGSVRTSVLERSALGVRRDDQRFVENLRQASAQPPTVVDETYSAVHGKRRSVRHRAHQQTFTFVNEAGARLELVVRVADDGVGFRYGFPEHDASRRKLVEEVTEFTVAVGARAWMLPHQPAGQYTPAYEDLFVEVPGGTSAPTPSGWSFPALVETAGGRAWVLITEADVDEHTAGTRLASEAPGGRYRIRLPEAGEGQGVGEVEPSSALPWRLPWRVLIVGESPSRVVESTLVQDLSRPSAVADTSWIQPGRVSWSWWSDSDSPRNEAALAAFIDLAAEMGWEYSLVDANWNLMDPAALQRVLAHAREKHVGVLLWYNSGGPHNSVTEQPRDLMHLRDVRRREFATLRDWGVKGVKVDFWQSDKQDRMAQYIDLLRDAAEFHLLVDFHGCTLPRGWSRTYPHLMSMEAVPGAEQYKFNAAYPKKAAWHNTVLAFTRNVVGPMDYTPVTFTDVKYPRVTTDGHELALSVVFESGLQHFADSVQAYRALPDAARTFLKAVPAAWDETRLLAGTPGALAVVARRSGEEWYMGGISGEDAPRTVDVSLSFLGPAAHHVSIVADGGGPRQLVGSTRIVTARDRLRMELQPRGGFVARVAAGR